MQFNVRGESLVMAMLEVVGDKLGTETFNRLELIRDRIADNEMMVKGREDERK